MMDDRTSPGRTQAQARKTLYGHLLGTLRLLPAGSALSLVHPDIPRARLHGGVTLPDIGTGTDAPTEVFDISYWVTGIEPEAGGHSFDFVVDSWRRAGWPTRTDRDSAPRAGYTKTPDGFGLSVRESVDGDVSLSGTTPPFLAGSQAGPAFPESIEHPLSAPEGSAQVTNSQHESDGRADRIDRPPLNRRSGSEAGPGSRHGADDESAGR
ncbi:hypothetical protein [Nocardia testacea]|uniref:hypothetical protein n=1 Tax=Nocardia testacea TaxID=248551 RepID=UPI003A89260A